MKKLKLFLKIACALFLCLCIGAVIFIKSININEYKPKIEETVSSALNRQFVIAHDIELGFSLSPTIILKDISLSNPEWAKNKNMATLKEVKVELSLLKLLYGKIYVSELDIDGLNVWLEVGKDGQNNWTFTPAENTENNEEKSSSGLGSKFLISYDFGTINVKNSSASYIDDSAGSYHDVKINNISLNGKGDLSLIADYNNISLTVNGKFPDLVDVMNGGKEFAFDVNASVDGKHNLTAKGEIENIYELSGIDISASSRGSYAPHLTSYDVYADVSGSLEQLSVNNIKVNAENKGEYKANATGQVSDALNIKGVDLKINADAQKIKGTPLKPISVKMTVKTNEAEKQFVIDSDISANETIIKGKTLIDLAKSKPYISTDLKADYFSLEDFVDFEANGKNDTDTPVQNKKEDEDEQLFILPTDTLPFDKLGLVNADLKASIADAVVTGTQKRASANVTASLKDSVLKTSFDAKERENESKTSKTTESLNGTVNLNAVNPSSATVTAKINGKDILMEEILQKFIHEKMQGGTLNLTADIQTKGNSVHQFASNLNGKTTVLFENATMSNNIVMALGGDILGQIMNLLKIDKSKSQGQIVDMQCAVVNLDFKDGVSDFKKKIAIETSKMFATVSGDLNLGAERMDLSLSVDSQEGLKLGLVDTLADLIKIKGTFKEPSVGISAVGTATTAATVGAAIMTGGLSLVGQSAYGMVKPTGSPCSDALGKPVASSKMTKKKAEAKPVQQTSAPAKAANQEGTKQPLTKKEKQKAVAAKVLNGIATTLKNQEN